MYCCELRAIISIFLQLKARPPTKIRRFSFSHVANDWGNSDGWADSDDQDARDASDNSYDWDDRMLQIIRMIKQIAMIRMISM